MKTFILQILMNMIIKIIFIFLLGITSWSNGEKHLKFTKHSSINIRKNVYVMENEDISVDCFTDQQILIKVMVDKGFTFHCQVKDLEEIFFVRRAEFCWKTNLKDKEQCSKITKEDQTIEIGQTSFEIAFNRRSGFSATKISGLLQGYYFCKLGNQFDEIVSNNIECHNLGYYQNLFLDSFKQQARKERHMFRTDMDSHTFDLGIKMKNDYQQIPKWFLPIFQDSIFWRMCPVYDEEYSHNWEKCFSTEIRLRPNIDYVLFHNFSIELFDHVYSLMDKFVLESNLKLISTAVMNKYPIRGRDASHRTSTEDIVIPSSSIKEFFFREGENEYFKSRISAAYFGVVQKYSWRRVSFPLSADFQQSERDLIFPPQITREHEGIYYLHLNTENSISEIILEFLVYVDSTPKISYEYQLPQVIYRFPNQEIQFKLRIEGKDLKTAFKINNLQIEHNKRVNYDLSMKQMLVKYPFLSQVQLQSSIKTNYDFNDVNVKIEKVNTLLPNRGEFLHLSFESENSIGIVRSRSIVDVIEIPVWKRTVDQVDCLEICPDERDYLFMCQIFTDGFSKNNFIIDQNWLVNDQRVKEFSEETRKSAYLNETKTSLVIRKSTDNNEMIFKVDCRITIKALQIYKHKMSFFEEIYNSEKDSRVAKRLQKIIRIVHISRKETINIDDIIMTINSILITFIFIVTLLVCFLFLKGSGKTRNLEVINMNHCLDSEKEYLDHDEFEEIEDISHESYLGNVILLKKHEPKTDVIPSVTCHEEYTV